MNPPLKPKLTGLSADLSLVDQAIVRSNLGLVGALGLKKDFGATGDARVVYDAVATASSAVITSATAAFTADDVGKTVGVPYAGADDSNGIGETWVGEVVSVDSATQITLDTTASTSIVGARTVTDIATTANSRTVTSATASFTAGDLGKEITIPGVGYEIGGGSDDYHDVRIIEVVSSTSVNVSIKCQVTATGKTVTIPGAQLILGTDDSEAMQDAIDVASSQGKALSIESGRYLITAAQDVPSNTNILGEGAGCSIIQPVSSTLIPAFQEESPGIRNVTFRNLEIDGSGVRANGYDSSGKALYIVDCFDLTVEGCYFHRTASTALGCDYLPGGIIANNRVYLGGNQAWEFGGGAGGSGIGIGTGKYVHEDVLISGNSCTCCGNRGIFTESQSSTPRSRGIRIIGNYSAFNGEDGIGDRACDGTIVANNISEHNEANGIGIAQGFVGGHFSYNTHVHSNIVRDNRRGIALGWGQGLIRIEDNTIEDSADPASASIYVTSSGSATNRRLVIRGNVMSCKNKTDQGRGIYLYSGSAESVMIDDNVIYDHGRSVSQYPAIESKFTAIDRLYIRNNTAFDTRATQWQDYGLHIKTGTIARLILTGNDFIENDSGTYDLTGATITDSFIDGNVT